MTAVVQAKRGGILTNTSLSVTLDTAPTQGNLVVALVSVSGTITNPVYPLGATEPDATATDTGIAYAFHKTAGANESATVTFSSDTARTMTLSVIEVAPTGGKSWNGLDKTATAVGPSGTSLAVGPTAAQAEADNFAAVMMVPAGTIGTTAPSYTNGYTAITGTDRSASGYKVLSDAAATSTTISWVTARTTAAVLATYKQTGGATPPPATGSTAAFLTLI